ncbi:sulfite exporter TauE/SafE family protein [Marinomonas epiphytica]
MDSTLLFLLLAGLISGFSKFSIGGMGLLVLPLLMVVFPGPEVLSILIPINIIIDILAIISYRKGIHWQTLAKVLPLSLAGVFAGTFLLASIDASAFNTILGIIIVGMLVLGIWLDFHDTRFMKNKTTGGVLGAFAGFISMISNAAGPLFSLYLMAQNLPKRDYIATRVWCIFFINLAKLPLFYSIGLLSSQSLGYSFQALPGLLVGCLIGYWTVNKLKFSQVKWLIRVMTTIAAVRLFSSH